MPPRAKAQTTQDKSQDKPRSNGRVSKPEWRGFVNLDLTEQQKQAAKLLRNDPDKLMDNIWGMVDLGYKLSVGLDMNDGGYVVSMTCQNPRDSNAGFCLTARGGQMIGAFAALWYKHEVILERTWGALAQVRTNQRDEDDLG